MAFHKHTPAQRKKIISKAKAKEILRHGEVKGHPLTEKQEGFFGARAGGAPVKGLSKKKKRRTSDGFMLARR